MRPSLTIILVSLLAFTGCDPRPRSLAPQLQSAGGAPALRQECAGFIAAYEQSKEERYAWTRSDTNFPPTIAALQPLGVSIKRYGDDLLLVDVRIDGGFFHHGLLVCPSNCPPGFSPSVANWRMTKIADGVFEYRE